MQTYQATLHVAYDYDAPRRLFLARVKASLPADEQGQLPWELRDEELTVLGESLGKHWGRYMAPPARREKEYTLEANTVEEIQRRATELVQYTAAQLENSVKQLLDAQASLPAPHTTTVTLNV